MQITFSPVAGSNPVCWTQSPAVYHIAIKAGLYRKAVQVCYIPIPSDILPLQIIVPKFLRVWESCETRLREFYANVCYLRWAPNVSDEEKHSQVRLGWESNPGHLHENRALYPITIKAGLYRKVCYISMPSDKTKQILNKCNMESL